MGPCLQLSPADNREPTRGPSQGWRITNTIINHNGNAQTTSSCTTPKKSRRGVTRKLLSWMPFWPVDTNMYVQASRQETEGFQKVSSTFDLRAWGWPVASGHALAQVGASSHLPAHHSGRQYRQERQGRQEGRLLQLYYKCNCARDAMVVFF